MLPVLLFFAPLAIYWLGLYGDFFLDDYAHIVHNSTIQLTELSIASLWAAANSTTSGPLGRPLALASFALNYYFTGLDPYYFKLGNLLIHAATTLGVYFLVRKIVRNLTPGPYVVPISFFAALVWAIHPLNVSTVLYAVQRMTVLAALFTVWGMVMYCHGRERLIEEKTAGWAWLIAGAIVGAMGLFAKETAVLMLGYLLVIEWLVFKFRMPSPFQQRILQCSYIVIIGLPLVWAFSTYLLASNWMLAAYNGRAFTMGERLLTESRVLWDYIYLILLPNIQSMGLYHDGYRISHGLLDPPATIITLSIHATALVAGWMLRRKLPYVTIAFAWFYIGHSAEASVLPLEIKYEHRNYLPMLGIVIAMIYGIFIASDRAKNPRRVKYVVLGAILITFSSAAVVRSAQFGDFWGFSVMEAEHYPNSSRANQQAAVAIMKLMMESRSTSPELVKQATEYIYRSVQANPNTTAPLFTGILFLPALTHQSVPAPMLHELNNRLRYALPDANLNGYFIALLRQAESGNLYLDSSAIHRLFSSATLNPRINNGLKADIIACEAGYALTIEKNVLLSLSLINKAIEIDPSRTGVYVPAVWIYQEAGLWQDAMGLLKTLKQQDIYGINSKSIEWLSQRQKKKTS